MTVRTHIELAIALHIVNELAAVRWQLSHPADQDRLLRHVLTCKHQLIVIFSRGEAWHTQSVLLEPRKGRDMIVKHSRGYRDFAETMERLTAMLARGDQIPQSHDMETNT